jgi:hypothetical protein
MTQLHKRFTDVQIRVLLQGHCRGVLSRAEVQEVLGIGKTRFFTLLKEYRYKRDGGSKVYNPELCPCSRGPFHRQSPNTTILSITGTVWASKWFSRQMIRI